jgi:hypothetical protein
MTYNTFTDQRRHYEGQLQQAREIIKTVSESAEMPTERKQVWIEAHQTQEQNAMTALDAICMNYYGQGYRACYWN